jgi:hypothetical protein
MRSLVAVGFEPHSRTSMKLNGPIRKQIEGAPSPRHVVSGVVDSRACPTCTCQAGDCRSVPETRDISKLTDLCNDAHDLNGISRLACYPFLIFLVSSAPELEVSRGLKRMTIWKSERSSHGQIAAGDKTQRGEEERWHTEGISG